MIISLQKHKDEKKLAAAKAALAAEACKPTCPMNTVFLRKCVEIIHQHDAQPNALKKRPSAWRSFWQFLSGELPVGGKGKDVNAA